tara:strand:+ start:2930 stop:3328 length:399 start_codon:yes stop_codon:yes gene_type:complete
MCFGGGSRATIVQPDYNAYDKQFELQKEAIQAQMNNESMLIQNRLTASLQEKQDVLQALNTQKQITANNVDRQIQQLMALAGPPPPEKSAEPPTIGAEARGMKGKGKSSLRIRRKTATKQGSGSGLNLTYNT